MSGVAQGLVRLPVWRARVVLVALALCYAVLGGRALYLQAVRTDFLQEKGDARYSRVLEIAATRGRILDRNGEALAVSTPVKSIWAIPGDVDAGERERRKLAALLGISKGELDKRVADTSRDFMYLKRLVAPETAAAVRALGMKELVDVDVVREELQDGDVVLLCSDGLSGMLPDPRIAELVRSAHGDLRRAAAGLVEAANEAGGVDNVTCVLVQAHR